MHLRPVGPQKFEQPPVTRTEVEDALSTRWHVLKQDTLPLGAVWKIIRAGEIAVDFLLVDRPLLAGHSWIIQLAGSNWIGRVSRRAKSAIKPWRERGGNERGRNQHFPDLH